MPLALSKAIELVSKLERTRNYPRDPEGEGVKNLARGLQKASDALKVSGALIIERCAETSEYCPTDADLFTVARDIARCNAVAEGTFDSMAGAGNHVAPVIRNGQCPLCHGTGWQIIYTLHTKEGGSHNFVRRENLTEAQARELEGKIDRRTQAIYSAAKKCHCPVPKDDFARLAAGDREE